MTSSPPRRWSELSRKEAKEILAAYLRDHPALVADLVEEIRSSGDDVGRFDFSRGSLSAAWTWLTTRHEPPERRASDEEMRASGPPWWYEFHPQFGQQLGPDLSRTATRLAAYFAETILRTSPGTEWMVDSDRGGFYNQPVLQLPNDRRVSPNQVVLFSVLKWADGSFAPPDRLTNLYDLWTARPAKEPPVRTSPYDVERGAEGQFETVVSFDDEVAHEEEQRIARLVTTLAQVPGIERVVHEDREIILIRAPRIDDPSLEATIARIWGAVAAGQSSEDAG
jgi:hypothetical protein